jgi:hypothetical protein
MDLKTEDLSAAAFLLEANSFKLFVVAMRSKG